MTGCHCPWCKVFKHWEMRKTRMKKNYIKLAKAAANTAEFHNVVGCLAGVPSTGNQRRFPARDQFAIYHAVGCCKNSHLVTQKAKFLRQYRNNPFGSAIVFGRNSFEKRSDMGYSHLVIRSVLLH